MHRRIVTEVLPLQKQAGLDDAMNDLNKAIELDPYLSDAYFSRAIFLCRQ